jgi:acyl-CoA synthetase (AMP-forming)/AMP-acid ligase II
VTSYANALRSAGVARRDGVALISPNVLELIPALLAAEAAAIAVPINPALDRDTLAALLPPAVRDAWLAHTGVALCEGYGLTEATCATARSFPRHQRPGSVGQRLP